MTVSAPALTTARSRLTTPDTAAKSCAQLLDLVRERAQDIEPWSVHQRGPLETRTYELVEWDESVEVWVIHWPEDGHLQLHDHGGSAGAFWVVGGTLTEGHATGAGQISHRHLTSGSGRSFGATHVHDVVNRRRGAATSVHAYSPPMPAMTFYNRAPGGLVADRTEYRASPTWAP